MKNARNVRLATNGEDISSKRAIRCLVQILFPQDDSARMRPDYAAHLREERRTPCQAVRILDARSRCRKMAVRDADDVCEAARLLLRHRDNH